MGRRITLRSKDLCDSYSSHVIRLGKSKMERGKREILTKFWLEKPATKRHLKNLHINGRIMVNGRAG
jgi:hypothetical protein